MEEQIAESHRIHFRRPIAGLRIVGCGKEPVPFEESKKREDLAYAKGRSDAETVCQRQILQARNEMAALQNRVLASIERKYKEFSDQFDEQLPDLVMSIVCKVWEGMKIGREDILHAIDTTLSQTGSDTNNLVLRLSKDDAALLQETEAFKTRYSDIAIEVDPDLKSGDVVVRSRFGTIDSRIDTKLRHVREEITKVRK